MTTIAVESSTLRAIAYHKSLAVLRLEFQSGAVYDYFGVAAVVHEALLRAPSIGACFNGMVRGCFPYDRVFPLDGERRWEGER